jgi:hypothetical protein
MARERSKAMNSAMIGWVEYIKNALSVIHEACNNMDVSGDKGLVLAAGIASMVEHPLALCDEILKELGREGKEG